MKHSNPEKLIQGRLKWFDGRNGFGFVVDANSQVDVLLTLGSILDFGWETIAQESWLRAYAFETERGLRVSEILEVIPPSELGDNIASGPVPAQICRRDYVPARVRWSDPELGYGFACTDGDSEDCFLAPRYAERGGATEREAWGGDQRSPRTECPRKRGDRHSPRGTQIPRHTEYLG